MKIYNINPEKSKIKWTSQIGDHRVQGELNAHHGKLISELGEIVSGNISVDLRSLKIVNSDLTRDQVKSIEKTIKSSPVMETEDAFVDYKFEEVISDSDNKLIKGILMVTNQAFGMDVAIKFDLSDGDLIGNGETQIENSNPVIIDQLDGLINENLPENTSIQSIGLACRLVGTLSK
jgi:transcriptional regulator of met regulon